MFVRIQNFPGGTRQTEEVVTGVVVAWEGMLSSRFGFADFTLHTRP
jgi:hypothetical protein